MPLKDVYLELTTTLLQNLVVSSGFEVPVSAPLYAPQLLRADRTERIDAIVDIDINGVVFDALRINGLVDDQVQLTAKGEIIARELNLANR